MRWRPSHALPPRFATPFVREMPKVGRNEMCPCGSGKKYKHCHGALQASKRRFDRRRPGLVQAGGPDDSRPLPRR